MASRVGLGIAGKGISDANAIWKPAVQKSNHKYSHCVVKMKQRSILLALAVAAIALFLVTACTASGTDAAETERAPKTTLVLPLVRLAAFAGLCLAPRSTLVILYFYGGHIGLPYAWPSNPSVFTLAGAAFAPFFVGAYYAVTEIGVVSISAYLLLVVGLAKQLALFGQPYYLAGVNTEIGHAVNGLLLSVFVAFGLPALASLLASAMPGQDHAIEIILLNLAPYIVVLAFYWLEKVLFDDRSPAPKPAQAAAATPMSPTRLTQQISADKYAKEAKEFTRQQLEELRSYLEQHPTEAEQVHYMSSGELLRTLDNTIKKLVS